MATSQYPSIYDYQLDALKKIANNTALLVDDAGGGGGGGGGVGFVTGPAVSTNNAIATFSGTNGRTIQNTSWSIAGNTLSTPFGSNFTDSGSGLAITGGGTLGSVTIAAGGTNQNLTLTPSGNGKTIVSSSVFGLSASSPTITVGAGNLNIQSASQSTAINLGDSVTNSTQLVIRGNTGTNSLIGNVFNVGNGSASAAAYGFTSSANSGLFYTGSNVALVNGGTIILTGNGGGVSINKIDSYNGVASAGWGVPEVVGYGRSVGAVAAVASVAAYTDATGADGSYDVSANVNLTAATTNAFTVTCTYTDETNTSRTLTMGFTQLSGATLLTSITNVTGTGPYEGIHYHIRCKASTAITIATVGTFTSVTYNVEGVIRRID